MNRDERPVTTHVLGEGDDLLHYDVHGDLATATAGRPALMTFANPMEAAAFTALAAEITDRPVITLDPRGAGRNPAGESPLTAEQHAEDLHRVVEALGVGAVDAFGSSGGAVCLLALLATHPDDVRRAVVHEPPLVDTIADGDVVLAACQDIRDTYDRAGEGAAMAKFIRLVMTTGPLAEDYLDQPAPDPVELGMSAEDDGSRTSPLMRNMPAVNAYVPAYDALASWGDRVRVAVGEESGHEVAARGGLGLARRIGREPDVFPSHHAGFTGEGPYPGKPAQFAARLLEVLG
ncbi:alpha/beta hydrolase [Nocardioides dongxiaopingii]|uniref:alpha/beta fold hydrolase n=1 Tax=Nocardioides sp. S-1144 TaxID=2582905 RepID=UPI00110E376B|nr:alpha/beta hydrolase [Nocardioides sp. S-1144]QCW49318.1 alpha/beta hydrolase [Nocardioides sp. S-1144]